MGMTEADSLTPVDMREMQTAGFAGMREVVTPRDPPGKKAPQPHGPGRQLERTAAVDLPL